MLVPFTLNNTKLMGGIGEAKVRGREGKYFLPYSYSFSPSHYRGYDAYVSLCDIQ